MRKAIALALIAAIFFSACSQKSAQKEFNKPAIYWYKKMIEQIRNGELEDADDTFISLQSEHLNSPLLPEAMLILAKGHMDKKEYQLANFYLDEYLKRFGTRENADFVRALKIKSNYLAFKLTNRDQQLLLDAIKDAEKFIKEHPYSEHLNIVNTMLVKMLLANLRFNKEIAALYKRVDKPEAAKFYENKIEYDWLKSITMEIQDDSWYRKLFNW